MKVRRAPIMFFVFALCAVAALAILFSIFPDHAASVGWLIYGMGSMLIFLVLLRRYRAEGTKTPNAKIHSSEPVGANRKELDGIGSRIRNLKREKREKREHERQ
ncbi:hypothetical protein [Desulfomonile tiedjei]|uniref:Uncharacterized protein n=1 Tax=Desulfomonile tiedjei (strain ATCC 49306 / DSM 6799 / DCB-1) TaxID=706587 RepID=I4C4C5_DESTA|nr:hypothetical protein [Desulfomonile tiedjei]AFM24416.1 hypothetical protein Desti_1706 [Desulfomonile tiedjei DSM 6799]